MTDSDRIGEVLRAAPLIDGHNDLLWALREARENGSPLDVADRCPTLHTDLPRLEAGRVGGQFWSVYVRSDLPAADAVTQTLEQIDALYDLVREHPGHLAPARTADDVERIAAAGKVACLIGIEGGHSIGNSLGTLRILNRLGAGYLTLTHITDTDWADSATGERPHGGLTRFGEEVVRELNRCGVLVDLSHVSDDVMRQAMQISEAPVLFSHSSARALCEVSRNVPDDVLEEVGKTGGVVMVTFVPSFLTVEGAEQNAAEWEQIASLRAEHADDPEAMRAAVDAYTDPLDEVPATVGDVADHIDHVRDVAGIDAIGIGSDFDGAKGMPAGLDDVSCYPSLFAELGDRGYADEDLMKIAGRNALRLMREAERVAARLRTDRPPSRAMLEPA
ncbi:MAG: dipeptidase [Actinomycetota bacterium]